MRNLNSFSQTVSEYAPSTYIGCTPTRRLEYLIRPTEKVPQPSANILWKCLKTLQVHQIAACKAEKKQTQIRRLQKQAINLEPCKSSQLWLQVFPIFLQFSLGVVISSGTTLIDASKTDLLCCLSITWFIKCPKTVKKCGSVFLKAKHGFLKCAIFPTTHRLLLSY